MGLAEWKCMTPCLHFSAFPRRILEFQPKMVGFGVQNSVFFCWCRYHAKNALVSLQIGLRRSFCGRSQKNTFIFLAYWWWFQTFGLDFTPTQNGRIFFMCSTWRWFDSQGCFCMVLVGQEISCKIWPFYQPKTESLELHWVFSLEKIAPRELHLIQVFFRFFQILEKSRKKMASVEISPHFSGFLRWGLGWLAELITLSFVSTVSSTTYVTSWRIFLQRGRWNNQKTSSIKEIPKGSMC